MPGAWHESGIHRRDPHVLPLAAKTESMMESE
jgi:hypothetical protein